MPLDSALPALIVILAADLFLIKFPIHFQSSEWMTVSLPWRVLGQSPGHLDSQFDRIIFRKPFEQGFKQYSLRALGYGFGRRNDLDVIFAED